MELKRINKVEIMSFTFKVKWNKSHNGGRFDMSKSIIEIGYKDYDIDPLYTISVISHEVMEAIMCMMGARYESEREHCKYLFNFNHQTFENAIQIHTQVMSKFIK